MDSLRPSIIDISHAAKHMEDPESASAILSRLQTTPKSVDQILMWDDDGQKLFNTVLTDPMYYPSIAEHLLIKDNADAIATQFKCGGTIVEMGAGNLHKTYTILRAIGEQQKHVHYVALDMAEGELTKCLTKLQQRLGSFTGITYQGLLGTYEDGAAWLSSSQRSKYQDILLLWLGTSMGNMNPSVASELLSKFSKSAARCCSKLQMLISIDGCLNPDKILEAYDLPEERMAPFIKNGLCHINSLLDTELFEASTWHYRPTWNARKQSLEGYCVVSEKTTRRINGTSIAFEKGERLLMMESRKYALRDMDDLCLSSGWAIEEYWPEATTNFGLYLIQATESM